MSDTTLHVDHAAEERRARKARRMRWYLGGPGAFVLSVLLTAVLPLVMPAGAGGIDHIVMPVILFPLLWAGLAIIPVWALEIRTTARVYGAMFLACCALIVYALI